MTIGYHEAYEVLSPHTRDLHRALASLYEEVEAIDWYNQRIEQATDDELRSILVHNRNEEMEHAAMALEFLRRAMPEWDAPLRTYLFSELPLVRMEAEAEGAPEPPPSSAAPASLYDGDLGIRKLQKGTAT